MQISNKGVEMWKKNISTIIVYFLIKNLLCTIFVWKKNQVFSAEVSLKSADKYMKILSTKFC